MTRYLKKVVTIIMFTAFVFSLSTNFAYSNVVTGGAKAKSTAKPKQVVKHPKVQFLMSNGKIMIFELYPEYAPTTVENFVKLAKAKFYDGLKFHRVINNFMIQGGDPKGDGSGGSGKNIYGECASNGFIKNTLKHTKGVISMARNPQSYDSASSQFFIMDGTSGHLDGEYAAFGKLISGEKTLDEISAAAVDYNAFGEKSKPKKDIIIKKIIVLNDGK